MQAAQEGGDAQQQLGNLSGMLPAELKYGESTVLGLPSVKTLREFHAENQATFTPTNNVIRIPVASSEFLDLDDCRLAFDLTNNSGAGETVDLDGGAGCVIDMLRVLSSQGVELERIEGYNLISTVQRQYTATDASIRESGALYGTQHTVHDNSWYNYGLVGIGLNPMGNDTLNHDITRHYELKLEGSGWFNPDLKKLLPPGASFVLELTLAPGDAALCQGRKTVAFSSHQAPISDFITIKNHGFVGGDKVRLRTNGNTVPATTPANTCDDGDEVFIVTAGLTADKFQICDTSATGTPIVWAAVWGTAGTGPYTLTQVPKATPTTLTYNVANVKLRVSAVRVEDPAFIDRVGMLRQRGYVWTAPTYKRYILSMTAGIGEETYQIADRSYSLEGLIGIIRATSKLTSSVSYQNSVRSINYLSQWQAQFGSQLYPPAAIKYNSGSGSSALHLGVGDNALARDKDDVNISEGFAEAKRLFGYGHGLVDGESFGQSEEGFGSGIMCICTKSFDSAKGLLSGLDTKSQALPISIKLTKVKANINGIDTFGSTTATGALHVYAKCSIQFSMQPETGVLTSAT